MKTNKQTPTQIASEVMKGCGLNLNNGFEYSTCGEWSEIHKQPNYLCKSCRKSILAYRTAWENELEFLQDLKIRLIEDNGVEHNILNKEISELTSALKILNTKEAEE